MKCLQAIIHGRVQGVGYRYYAYTIAQQLNIRGWVKNLSDGTVEAYIEGADDDVLTFVDYLKKGPSHAVVTTVEINEAAEESTYSSFLIK